MDNNIYKNKATTERLFLALCLPAARLFLHSSSGPFFFFCRDVCFAPNPQPSRLCYLAFAFDPAKSPVLA